MYVTKLVSRENSEKRLFSKTIFTGKSKTFTRESSEILSPWAVWSRCAKGHRHPNARLPKFKKNSCFLKRLSYFQGSSPICWCQYCKVRINFVCWEVGHFGERTKVYWFRGLVLDRGSSSVCFILAHNAKVFVFVCLYASISLRPSYDMLSHNEGKERCQFCFFTGIFVTRK